jgi:hypothetical protein
MGTLTRLALSSRVLAGATWATASLSAEATASVNVRSGPGVGYAVVDTLSPGETVDIDRRVIAVSRFTIRRSGRCSLRTSRASPQT